jgi:hypothetical protein
MRRSTKDKGQPNHRWDVFLSHASEDKIVARMLTAELEKVGLRVWHDETVITPGQSIRRAIDQGLTASVVGVVIISPSFLRKHWAQLELDGMFDLESKGLVRIIPLRHRIKLERLTESVPLLTGRNVGSAQWRWREKNRDIYVGDLAELVLSGMADLLPTLPLSKFSQEVEIWWGVESSDEVRLAFPYQLPEKFIQRLQKEYNESWLNLDQLKEGLVSILHSLALYDNGPDDFRISSGFKMASWRGLIRPFLWRPRGLRIEKRYDSISIRIFPDGYELHLWTAGHGTHLEDIEPKDIGIEFDRMGRGTLAVARCFLETDATFAGEPTVIFDKDEGEWPIVADFF